MGDRRIISCRDFRGSGPGVNYPARPVRRSLPLISGGGGGGAVITTRGQGYNILPGQGFGSSFTFSANAGSIFAVANTVYLLQVVILDTISVGAIVLAGGTGSTAGNIDVGFYKKDGSSLLFHIGSTAVVIGGAFAGPISPPVILSPDTYWYAWTSATTTITLNGFASLFNTGIINGVLPPAWGNTSTPSVGNVLPSSIALPITAGAPTIPMANLIPFP